MNFWQVFQDLLNNRQIPLVVLIFVAVVAFGLVNPIQDAQKITAIGPEYTILIKWYLGAAMLAETVFMTGLILIVLIAMWRLIWQNGNHAKPDQSSE